MLSKASERKRFRASPMAHPARDASLTSSRNTLIYQFNGTQTSVIASVPPPTIFDSASASSEEHDEKTGFYTPDEESEIPLAHAFPRSYSTRYSQAPLIDYAKNDWKAGSTLGTGEEDDDFCPEGWVDIICSRAFKRWMMLYVVLMTVWLVWWFRWYQPNHKISIASRFMVDSLKGRFLETSEYGYFGSNRQVEFAGLKVLENLDRKLVPGTDVPGVKNRRLIVVGDIHGCAEELEVLLQRASLNLATDHLITTGNMISKGPKSQRVLDILNSHQASCIRGNQEDRVLYAHRDYHAPGHQRVLGGHQGAAPSAIALKRGQKADLELASTLTPTQIGYLTSCSVILNLGQIPSMGANVSVAHAGLVPGVPLEGQDPVTLMSMRALDLRNHAPSFDYPPDPTTGPPPRPRSRYKKPDYTNWDEQGRLAVLPWFDIWDTFQEMIPELHKEGLEIERKGSPNIEPGKPVRDPSKPLNPYKHLRQSTVIHGHDSGTGIVQGKWHIGLDGGCYKGGKLAALIIEEAGPTEIRKRIISVDCRDYRSSEEKNQAGAEDARKDA